MEGLYGIVLMVALFSLGEGRPKGPVVSSECPKRCPNLWEPVCGSDGRTYSNKCQLDMVVGCWGEKVLFQNHGKCPECQAARANAKPGLLGAFVPSCKDDGTYEEKQCHGSIGYCWCVDENGKEIEGSKKGPGQGDVNCGACALKRANAKPGLLGAFFPSCKDDGTYEEKQCHGSTGHCWCVDDNGKEIEGSRKGPGEGEANCKVPDPCTEPKLTGMCRAAIPAFYFDQETKSCKTFVFGGCGGNGNNFDTEEDCKKKCGK